MEVTREEESSDPPEYSDPVSPPATTTTAAASTTTTTIKEIEDSSESKAPSPPPTTADTEDAEHMLPTPIATTTASPSTSPSPSPSPPPKHKSPRPSESPPPRGSGNNKENDDLAEIGLHQLITVAPPETDPEIIAQMKLIATSTPATPLELALTEDLARKQNHLERLTAEIVKLKHFISKRKQTYKRKRKDDGAPTRALSAYNLFIRERFAQLAKDNAKALKSEDVDCELKRVAPASLVAQTGNEWKLLPAEEKARYEVKAKSDRKRYDDQMAQYNPPDKQANRKRNKTGYNMFFSAHVLRLKQTESGVPSERGSVARLVGTAWKQLSMDEKQYYEREADKHNDVNPVKDGEDDDDETDPSHQQAMDYHMQQQQQHLTQQHPEMMMAGGPPGAMPMAPPHDGRHPHHAAYYAPPPHPSHPPHLYAHHPPPPYAHYDYSQHHGRARASGYQQQGYPPPQRHYDA